jgi:hypothetical protein
VTSPNPILGYWKCERGGRAEVRQTKKKGRHLYTQCQCCGLNQGTGDARQQQIWDEMETLPEATIVRPSNVQETKPYLSEDGATEPKKPSEPEPKAPSDFDPAEPEPESEPEPTASGFSGTKLVAGLALILAAGAGAWMG